jgi:predicted DCC family thiol-disulfide oxidoreductase YuxK
MAQTSLEKELRESDGVILFDGHCAFCRNIVGLLLRVCRERRLLVCSTRSIRGTAVARALGSEPADTFAFVTSAAVHIGVNAYVQILSRGSRTAWLGRVVAMVPHIISDSVYNWTGSHRPLMSSLWGKRHRHPIPSDRFVSGGI